VRRVAFFSQTMSRCPCSTRAGHSRGRASRFFTATLPTASTLASSPRRLAVARTYFEIAASCFEQRGSGYLPKYFHKPSASTPLSISHVISSPKKTCHELHEFHEFKNPEPDRRISD